MKCNKKFLKLALLGSVASSLSNANSLNNFYVGANGGLGAMQAKTNTSYGAAPDTREFRLSDHNISGDVLLGWCMPIQKWHLGVEINGGASALKAKDNSVVNIGPDKVDRITLKEQYNFGGALKIGHHIADKMLAYLKLGARFSRFQASHQDIRTGVLGTLYKKDKTQPGFEVGFGTQVAIAQCWSMFGEYSHTFYGKMEMKNLAGNANGYPKYRFKPQIGRANIGIIYHLGR